MGANRWRKPFLHRISAVSSLQDRIIRSYGLIAPRVTRAWPDRSDVTPQVPCFAMIGASCQQSNCSAYDATTVLTRKAA